MDRYVKLHVFSEEDEALWDRIYPRSVSQNLRQLNALASEQRDSLRQSSYRGLQYEFLFPDSIAQASEAFKTLFQDNRAVYAGQRLMYYPTSASGLIRQAYKVVQQVLNRSALLDYGYDYTRFAAQLDSLSDLKLQPYTQLMLPNIAVQPEEYDLFLQLMDPDSRSVQQNTMIALCHTKFLQNFIQLFVLFLRLPVYDFKELQALARTTRDAVLVDQLLRTDTLALYYRDNILLLDYRYHIPNHLERYIGLILVDPLHSRLASTEDLLFPRDLVRSLYTKDIATQESILIAWSDHLLDQVTPTLASVAQTLAMHLQFRGETRVAAIPSLVQHQKTSRPKVLETILALRLLANDSEMARHGLAKHSDEEQRDLYFQNALNSALFS